MWWCRRSLSGFALLAQPSSLEQLLESSASALCWLDEKLAAIHNLTHLGKSKLDRRRRGSVNLNLSKDWPKDRAREGSIEIPAN